MISKTNHRFQFSLRTLLILIAVISLGLGFLFRERNSSYRQRLAAERLDSLASVRFENVPERAEWLKLLWGDNGRAHAIVQIEMNNTIENPSEFLQQVAECRNVKKLELLGGGISDSELKLIRGMRSIIELSLYGNAISDHSLKMIANLTGLETLDLSNTKITDMGLKHLGQVSKLQSLSLGSTNITDAGLAHLGRLSDLQSLDLSDTVVSDRGLPYLIGLANLRSLQLSGTKVTNLDNALENMANLQVIGLDFTELTDEAFETLSKVQSLYSLNLINVSMSGNRVLQLSKSKHLHSLDLNHLPEGAWKNLPLLKSIAYLRLQGIDITDEHLAYCGKLSLLKQFELTQTSVQGPGLLNLGSLPQLNRLRISGAPLTGEYLRHLHNSTELEYLQLDNVAVDEASVADLLSHLPKIKRLEIYRTNVTNEGIMCLLETVDKIRGFDAAAARQ